MVETSSPPHSAHVMEGKRKFANKKGHGEANVCPEAPDDCPKRQEREDFDWVGRKGAQEESDVIPKKGYPEGKARAW